MHYLYIFGFLTPELIKGMEAHDWDGEVSEAVFIEASSESEALAWGIEISREFIRRLYGNQGLSWDAADYAHWIESAPGTRWTPEVLECIPIVRVGEHPALNNLGFAKRGTCEQT